MVGKKVAIGNKAVGVLEMTCGPYAYIRLRNGELKEFRIDKDDKLRLVPSINVGQELRD